MGTREITLKAFLEFYKKVGAKETCPFCGQTDWIVQFGEPGVLLLTDTGDPPTIKHGQGVPVLYLFCKNCGYVRLQAINPFLEQKEADANDPR